MTNTMSPSEIALLCWNNRRTVSFGNEGAWSENVFRVDWFKSNDKSCWVHKSEASGWYWFEVEMDVQDLIALEKPTMLPQKACDFGAVARSNADSRNDEICHNKSAIQIVYNGEANDVLNRVRAHFALANDTNGALGIKHYPLSNKKWAVSVFHKGILKTLACLTAGEKMEIAQFCDSEMNRTEVESAWRIAYGWPVLCKV